MARGTAAAPSSPYSELPSTVAKEITSPTLFWKSLGLFQPGSGAEAVEVVMNQEEVGGSWD